MINNLFFLNLFLAVQTITALGMAAYSWLYFDSYSFHHRREHLLRGLGGAIISIGFLSNLVNNISSFLPMALLSIGLTSILVGNFIDPIPGEPHKEEHKKEKSKGKKPTTKKEKLKVTKTLNGIFLTTLNVAPYFNLIAGLLILVQTFKKITDGKSKEFISLLVFWGTFCFYLSYTALQSYSVDHITYLNILTENYSLLWIVAQISLLIGIFFLFQWVSYFMSFRIIPTLFLKIWLLIILSGIILASGFSVFMIRSSETQIFSLLNNNSQLVRGYMKQIEENNTDILEILSDSRTLIQAVSDKDTTSIQNESEHFLLNNSYLDQVIIVDNFGISIYDSDEPETQGVSMSSNLLIKKAIKEKKPQKAYRVEEKLASANQLTYQISFPLMQNGELLGVISTVKRVDDNFLDLIQKNTNQEIVVFVDGMRSASTIRESDNLSRAEKLPTALENFKLNPDKSTYGTVTLITTPYYTSLISLPGYNNKIVGQMLLGTKQSILISANEKTLYNTFTMTLFLVLLATIPSYWVAKKIERNSRV